MTAPAPSHRTEAVEGDARIFAPMTFRGWQPLLENVSGRVKAFAAYADETPCAFLLGVLPSPDEPLLARLLSLYVHPNERRKGIGRALIHAFCAAAAPDGLWTRWSCELPQAPAFEKLLAATGWSEKTIDTIQVSTTPRRIIDYANSRSSWRTVNRIGGYTWTLWSERSASDDETILEIVKREDFPAKFDPVAYAQAHMIWEPNSMMLRLRGTPVGWILTRQLDGVLLYDCHYVRPDLGRIGAIIPMMVAMFRRQADLLGPDSACRYFVPSETPSMMALTRGGFAGAHSIVEHYVAVRRPNNPSISATQAAYHSPSDCVCPAAAMSGERLGR